jgi:type IV secretory pathway TrbD component
VRSISWPGYSHKSVSHTPTMHPVYRSLNKVLTIMGAERRLFFLAAVIGAAMFNLFGSLMGGLLMFIVLYMLARWATVTDPQILRILLNSSKFRAHYDPAQRDTSIDRRRIRG